MDLPMIGLAVVVVVAFLLAFWGRKSPEPAAGDPVNSPTRFVVARRHGYVASDVEDLLDRVYEQPWSSEGRAEALKLLSSARFHLARDHGYEPGGVDQHVDALVVALESGQELPIRPAAG